MTKKTDKTVVVEKTQKTRVVPQKHLKCAFSNRVTNICFIDPDVFLSITLKMRANAIGPFGFELNRKQGFHAVTANPKAMGVYKQQRCRFIQLNLEQHLT